MKHRKITRSLLKSIYMLLIVFAVLFLGIGYAAMSGSTLEIDGQASSVQQTGEFISQVEYYDSYGVNTALSSLNTFYQLNFSHKIVLGSDLSSWISYTISVYNGSDTNLEFKGLSIDPVYHTNNDIICEADIPAGTSLPIGGTLTFHATYKYDPGLTAVNDNYGNTSIIIELQEPDEFLGDVRLYSDAVVTTSPATTDSSWTTDANQNGYSATTQNYRLKRPTYTGNNSVSYTLAIDNLSWKVWSKDPENNTVTLISTTPTSQVLGFRGHVGFLNSVFLLDDICQSFYGAGAGMTARSIRMRDIEEKIIRNHGGAGFIDGYGNPIWSVDNVAAVLAGYNDSPIEYHKLDTIATADGSQPNLPDIYTTAPIADLTGIVMDSPIVSAPVSNQDIIVDQKNSITAYQSDYSVSSSNLSNLLSTEEYKLLFNTDDYFLATRTINFVDVFGIEFGIGLGGSSLTGSMLSNAAGGTATMGNVVEAKIRPMLTIDLNIMSYTVAADGTVTFQ